MRYLYIIFLAVTFQVSALSLPTRDDSLQGNKPALMHRYERDAEFFMAIDIVFFPIYLFKYLVLPKIPILFSYFPDRLTTSVVDDRNNKRRYNKNFVFKNMEYVQYTRKKTKVSLTFVYQDTTGVSPRGHRIDFPLSDSAYLNAIVSAIQEKKQSQVLH